MSSSVNAPSCRLCGSAACDSFGSPIYRRPLKVGGVPIDLSDLRLTHRRCRNCGYRFVDPPVPERRLLDCYRHADGAHWATDERVASDRSYRLKKDLLVAHTPGQRVLDFGCFDGGFLAHLGGAFDRFGIEPSSSAAQLAAARGINVLGSTLDALDGSDYAFDAIIVFDVMEHLVDPMETLRKLRMLLAPKGVIIIETGNSDAWTGLGRFYPYCGLVEHVGFFNRRSMDAAARIVGLDIVHWQQTQHSRVSKGTWLASQVKNVAYCLMRGVRRTHIPLRPLWADIADGPFPRATCRHDHFLAVLRRAAPERAGPEA